MNEVDSTLLIEKSRRITKLAEDIGELCFEDKDEKDSREEISELKRDLSDAICVLNSYGLYRQACKSCKRRTITSGYICWNCGHDDSNHGELMIEEEDD